MIDTVKANYMRDNHILYSTYDWDWSQITKALTIM